MLTTKNLFRKSFWNRTIDPEYSERNPIEILVLTFNRLEYLKKCLWSLYTNTRYPFKIIIMDNNSEDGTTDFLKKLEKLELPFLEIIYRSVNEGTAEGKNLALRLFKGNLIALSDDDVWYNPGWLTTCIKILDTYPDVLISTAFFNNESAEHIMKYNTELDSDNQDGVPIIYRKTTCPMQIVLRRKPILDLGGFKNIWRKKGYEGKGLMGYSGARLCQRVNASGNNIARIAIPFNKDGERFVTPMDRKESSMNEIQKYKKSGYNAFRKFEKGI